MSETKQIEKRCEFVFLYDVTHGNPNGDPDAGNQPRVDPETGYGLVTDVCLKRKIRNYVALTKGYAPPHDIYVKDRGILANEQRRAYKALGIEATDRPNMDARKCMCENFYDVRTFAAVMTTDKAESGQMGRKYTVPYGLYRAHGFISPFLAQDTGFAQADLDLLFEALSSLFEFDH